MSLYKLFKTTKPTEKTKFVKVYRFQKDGENYKIILAKRCANRRSIIHCKDELIEWEQFPMLPRIWGARLGESLPIYKFKKTNNETVIFVVKGKPNGITGLDDGIFRSIKKFDKDYINVMILKSFKALNFQ